MRKIILSLCLVLVYAVPLSGYGVDKNPAQKQSQLTAIKQRIDQLKNYLTENQSKQAELSKTLQETELDIVATTQQVKKIQHKTAHQKERLTRLQQEQAAAEKKLAEAQHALVLQIRSAYLLPRQEPVKLLLNQQNTADLGRIMTYYHYFNQHRLQQIEHLRFTIKSLVNNQKQVKQATQTLQGLQAQQENQMERLIAQKTARQTIMDKISRSIQTQTTELNTLKQNKANLEKIIERLQKEQALAARLSQQSLRQSKKNLPWPTQGIIARHFGSPIENSDLTWNGTLISAPENQNVFAVFSGKVIFADWLKGFGMLMIVDHGDGYISLYGRNSALYKHVGDEVAQKELIAAVGQTGGFAESGLYFELRHNGKPVNPENWLSIKNT